MNSDSVAPRLIFHPTFDDELSALEAEFASMRADLEVTVRDRSLGVEGYVVVWNAAAGASGPLGPCGKGGTRITPEVSLAEVAMLAQRMALKNAAAGLPLGGAKSGLRGDPAAPGFERQYRRFVQLVRPILRENGGVFGGFGFDIGARPEHALWACDELGSTRSFTGKPINRGGTDYDREGIAGYGVALAAKASVEQRGEAIAKLSAAVQGAGAMGAAVIRYLSELGCAITAVADPRLGGTVLAPGGLPPAVRDAIVGHELDAQQEIARAGLERAPLDAVLAHPADILLPCALQDVLNEANAAVVRARYLVEGANNPCSSGAQQQLFERGVTVIPDFIANPGGIIAAYVELTSSVSDEENTRTRQKVHEAKALTEQRITENVHQMLRVADGLGVNPVRAARQIALRRIFSESPQGHAR